MDESDISYSYHQYCTLIGGIVTNSIIGSILSWMTTMPVFLSYFINCQFINKNSNHNTLNVLQQKPYYYIFFSTLITTANITNAISPFISFTFNIKKVLMISFTFLITSHILLLNYSFDYFLTTVAFGMFGIGIGFPYQKILINLWKFYPKNKGVISFVNVLFFSLSSCIYSEYYNKKAKINEEQYNEKDAKDLIWNNILIYVFFGFIVFLMSFDYYDGNSIPKVNVNNDNKVINSTIELNSLKESNNNIIINNYTVNFSFQESKITKDNENMNTSFISQNSMKSTRTNIYNLIGDDNASTEVRERKIANVNLQLIFLSSTIYIITISYFLSLVFSFTIILTIYLFEVLSLREIQTYIRMFIISVTLTKIFLPFIIDNLLKCKTIILISLSIQTIISFTITGESHRHKVFSIYIILSGICYSSLTLVISPLIMKIYDNRLSMLISGIVIGVGTLSCWGVCFEGIYLKDKIGLSGMFNIGGITSIIGLFVFLMGKYKAFDYSTENESSERLYLVDYSSM